MKNAIICTEWGYDLKNSHKEHRVFFVSGTYWDDINRATNVMNGQTWKEHGKWHFILMDKWVGSKFVEVPVVSWWVQRRNDPYHVSTLTYVKNSVIDSIKLLTKK